MRAIDADELMELYADAPDIKFDMMSVPIPVVRQNILDMPTIDPEDLRPKGEWLKRDDYHCCSHCGQAIGDACVPWFKFCPNCGSKNVSNTKE